MRASSDSETAASGSPAPADSGKAKQHGEQQDGRAQTVHKLLIRHGSGNTRRRSRGSAGGLGGQRVPQRRRIPGRCAPPARLVSRLNGPSKENPFQGTPGTGIQSTQTPLKGEGMDSALAGLGREKRSLQKGPPSPMPPCRFKRNGPYSFSGSASLRNHSGLWCLMCSSGTYPVNMDRSAGASPGAKAAM